MASLTTSAPRPGCHSNRVVVVVTMATGQRHGRRSVAMIQRRLNRIRRAEVRHRRRHRRRWRHDDVTRNSPWRHVDVLGASVESRIGGTRSSFCWFGCFAWTCHQTQSAVSCLASEHCAAMHLCWRHPSNVSPWPLPWPWGGGLVLGSMLWSLKLKGCSRRVACQCGHTGFAWRMTQWSGWCFWLVTVGY